MSAPSETLASAVEECASPGDHLFVFHLDGEQVARSARQLVESAWTRAGILLSRGLVPGEAVGVLGPNSPEWLEWAFAVWFAGGALVPIPYPLRIRDRELFALQSAAMASAVRCRVVVAHERFLGALPVGLGIPWDVRSDGRGARAGGKAGLAVAPDDPAVLQLTSGATTRPKAAVLSHRAVLAAVASHRAHHGYREREDVGVSWLPFFHDNGLFGHVLLPLLNRGESHVIPTESFARSPGSWFRTASAVRATITSGPSSAWAIALGAALRRPEGLDLSSLRLAVLSAETIDPDTVDRLVARGPSLGLRPGALAGGYGLAEATLGVTTGRPGEGIRIDVVALDELARSGRAVPRDSGRTKRVASCGFPLPGTEIRIVGPDGTSLSDRAVGEILVRSPALMRSYAGRAAPDPFEGDWLHTGDLGYTVNGELFVTGRIKELIVSYGRNYNPEDLERAAARLPEVRPARVVAFAPPDEPDGAAIVAFEPTNEGQAADLPMRIRQLVADATGISPRVIAVPRGSIPRTTSGKLKRTAVKWSWMRGELAAMALASDPPVPTELPPPEIL